ncbi:interferon-induced, double-stranded RNA-activated protein kinase [Genypterus blacodes]|uniref:interferon-induced, double-stranded RNA-activated protein kinase n=1 Tax=Genypterus blacodes TaxID=154954 RepID=UPI003F771B65
MMENYIAKLNEHAQKNRLELKYEDVACDGPDHIRTFTLRVVLNGQAYPSGVGKNKKEAKQNAAKNALKGLLEEGHQHPVEPTSNTAESLPAPVHETDITQPNYICWLNEYSQKNGLQIRAVESTRVGQTYSTLFCSFVVGDKEYPAAPGRTKRDAKEEAAKLVYRTLYGSKTTEVTDHSKPRDACQTETSGQQKNDILHSNNAITSLNIKDEEQFFEETNYIGILNHYCQKTNRNPDFKLEKRCGPAHNPQFFYRLIINNEDYPVGEGKNVKDARQQAAKLAWQALQERSDWNSQVSNFNDTPSKLSTTGSTLESLSLLSPSTGTGDSVLFKSSHPAMDQDGNADVKPKRRIAANFLNVRGDNRKDVASSAVREKNAGIKPSEKPSSQLVSSRFRSDFDSIEDLGHGAFGSVFKARDKLLDKYFAVKIVRGKEKALREVAALADLQHQNIVRYYTCWKEESKFILANSTESYSTSSSSSSLPHTIQYLYIQMELCDTRTLRVWIDELNIQNAKKTLKDTRRRKDSLSHTQELVSGVEYIHSMKLIHRDLKPANILFGVDCKVKIGDFGLVTAEIDDDEENLIERSVYKGTPSYMAPEQRNKLTYYDRKVDIFAVGLIYFELLWKLYTGHERKVVWDGVRDQKFPEGFSQHFPREHNVIKSMLCAKPEERPEARDVKILLEECDQTVNTDKRQNRTVINMEINILPSLGFYSDAKFTWRAMVNGQAYPPGKGRTRKEAKQNAAKHARRGLEEKAEQDQSSTVDENYRATSRKEPVLKLCNKIQGLNVKPNDNTVKKTNYIGLVTHFCEKTKRICNYIEMERRGQAPDVIFVYKVVIDLLHYPLGTGRTIKEARQHAAQLAWSALQEQSDWDSKVSVRSTGDGSLSRSRGSVDRSSQNMATSDSKEFTASSNSSKNQTSPPPGRFMSEFDSMEHLGNGGFGCVYKVREKFLDKNYAVKIVKCEEKALKEVKALSDLHHPNIVRYYSCWVEDSRPPEEHMNGDSVSATGSTSQSSSSSSPQYLYIKMELCDSETLKVWIDGKNGEGSEVAQNIRRAESLIIAQQIVSGIQYIHNMELFHRDLKPENLMIGKNRTVKIVDFGLVTADTDNDANHVERTQSRGTSSYMAPEQRSGTKYDHKVDIFALGIIYFELLWKLYTYHEKRDIWDAVRSQNLPTDFAQKFPPEDTLIKSMLCLKPEDRPEASEVKTEMENIARTLPKK